MTQLGRDERPAFHLGSALLALALAAASGSSSVSGADDAKLGRAGSSGGRVVAVGKDSAVRSLSEAARLARDGDVVEVQAGDYVADVAVWTQRHLTIRGVGGRARLIAGGASAESKGIWVIRRGTITVENMEFVGARVPDRNGAGIRFESGRLAIRNCRFEGNENGILTGNDPASELEIQNSEFVGNGFGDGQSHNLYVGAIGRLVVEASYFSRARIGHLLKSRARESFILYNRLTDEPDGRASYELEFPSGGLAVVLGNLIQQDAGTDNSTIISFGAEGYRWPRNELHLSHNTIVNDRPGGGTFVFARPGNAVIHAVNNVLVGQGGWNAKVEAKMSGNVALPWSEFALPTRFDYRLKAGSRAARAAKNPGAAGDVSLRPTKEYVHPAHSQPVDTVPPLTPGAFQSLVR